VEASGSEQPTPILRSRSPGALFPWVKWASWIELGLFAGLLFFWVAPGFEHQTFIFGLSHGLGFIVLCLLIFVAVLRREAPYWLLAISLTPVGPVGSVIGIEIFERRIRAGAQNA
jgi:hypothetical protein